MLNMDDYTEETLRKVCCTCLSIDRKLHQLCKLDDGINNLFYLLSSDPEAYEAMFSRDATLLFICWECSAIMRRQNRFREQACIAQKQLSQILDQQLLLKSENSLSKLTSVHQNTYNIQFVHDDNIDNFIDCGPDINDIKCELESNITAFPVNNESADESTDEYTTELLDEIKVSKHCLEINPLLKKTRKLKKENIKKVSVKRKVKDETDDVVIEGFSKIKMTDEEMIERVQIKKLEESYVNATSKCESCVEVFKDDNELEDHNSRLHVQKPKLVQCDICLIYIKFWWLPDHRDEHCHKYQCNYCELVSYTLIEILTHLRVVHSVKDALALGVLKKLKRKAMLMNPVLAAKKQNQVHTDGEPLEFKCNECNKYFENRCQRYKHILKSHREGHTCSICGKTFAIKNTLIRHQQVHAEPPPRQPCPVCNKLVRADRVQFHARIHSDRKSFECVSCDKRFISRDSYEKHLKYSKKHAVRDLHKYKCTMCDKGFRTKTELNDHIDYKHMGKTQHKCPICHKDKKCLREHELIHSGEKPLSCDECGRTFRQSACLYTHKRRVHKMAAKRARVRHASGSTDQVGTETSQ